MNVSGACHCGAIRFSAVVDPDTATICHCADCQALSGSVFRVTIAARRHDVNIMTGAPVTYDKQSASGVTRRLAFCPVCASSLWSTDAHDPEADLDIRTGVLQERAALPPRRQIWTASALPWLGGWPDLPGRDTQ